MKNMIENMIESLIESLIKSLITLIKNLIENLVESRSAIEFKLTCQVDWVESRVWLNSTQHWNLIWVELSNLNLTTNLFTAHQKILYKKLITATCVKNCLKETHKFESLKIQKFILKEMMIVNDIVKEILNVKCFVIHSILIIYHFVSISNCFDIF